jgi:hypothetical protein
MRGEWRAVVQCLGAGAAVCSRSEKKKQSIAPVSRSKKYVEDIKQSIVK